jgi:hypothetical protein
VIDILLHDEVNKEIEGKKIEHKAKCLSSLYSNKDIEKVNLKLVLVDQNGIVTKREEIVIFVLILTIRCKIKHPYIYRNQVL